MSHSSASPKQRKPRSVPKRYQPCDRCKRLTSPESLQRQHGLCQVCIQADDAAHQTFLAEQAIVIVRFDCSHWTPNLFSSSLGIDADGYWMQRVRWHETNPDRSCHGEQIDVFESQEWQAIWTEIKDLQTDYHPRLWRMDSMETHAIEWRQDHQTYFMEALADWQCSRGLTRFQRLWAKIHRQSQWHDRLVRSGRSWRKIHDQFVTKEKTLGG